MQVIFFSDTSAGYVLGVIKDEERREGVGVLKEECHLSLRPHFRICHVLSEYL